MKHCCHVKSGLETSSPFQKLCQKDLFEPRDGGMLSEAFESNFALRLRSYETRWIQCDNFFKMINAISVQSARDVIGTNGLCDVSLRLKSSI